MAHFPLEEKMCVNGCVFWGRIQPGGSILANRQFQFPQHTNPGPSDTRATISIKGQHFFRWRLVGYWLETGWRMVGEWLENGWRMVREWLENGWRMVGEWLENGWTLFFGVCGKRVYHIGWSVL